MKHLPALVLVLASVFSASTTFAADEDWKIVPTYTAGKRAAIKVVSPKGMKMQFTENGVQKEDTVPHVIVVPDEDSFVPVTFIDKSGEKYSEKIEVKAGQVSELKVTYTAKVVPPPPPPVYKGKIIFKANMVNCEGQVLKLKVTGAKSATLKDWKLSTNTNSDVQLPKDAYEILFTSAWLGKETKLATKKVNVAGDGFLFGASCDAGQFVITAKAK